ncbi:GntR family transcriptional regulator [Schlegelella sp. ID0723]|uniref:GntR family transcriptional regulator n=1 Tax=Piscinibacter koreensis TaxID=2742824 RepID=A0A7Y6NNH2_9BURK|nr:GntR family transcriptional regulator [Schlegelella koreensis]
MSRLSERLREAIEEEIATGKLLPGHHLDEVELATRFGVSRTPIREALNLLLGEGLIENRPRRGSVVAHISPQRLVEMFEVMAELEAMCAQLASRRMTDEELAAIEAAHEAGRGAASAGDPDAYFYANERFHYALYAASHNSFLFEEAAALQRKLRPYRRLQLRVRHRMQRSFEEHQAIVDALRVGDTAQAALSVRSHVVVQGERFADLLASLSRMTEGAWQPEPATALKTLPVAPVRAGRAGADGATALPRPPRTKPAARPRARPAPVEPTEG